MVWYSHLFQNFLHFIVIYTVKGFGIVNKAEIDVFLELSCCFDDLEDVSNLISGSSAFSKTSLSIWKFTVHILLKPGLDNVGSHQKKIPHIQGQRRSPSKMVGGAKSHLESNPIAIRDARRAQTKLCAHQETL